MKGYLATFTVGFLAMTGAVAASELAPGNGHSIHLGRFNGAVYYTVEQDGYRVVATLASAAEEQPIRFTSTLEQGQRVVISVPQAAGQPSLGLEILRDGEALLVSDVVSASTSDPPREVATTGAPGP